MEQSFQKTERVYLKLGTMILIGLVLLVGLIWGGHEIFVRVREHRLMNQAHASFEKGDDRWATIAAQRVFELNPKNADACRVLAQVAEKNGQPFAIEWRRRVLAILPESVEDGIALAKTALRFGDLSTAERALDKIAATGGGLATFHEAKGQLAVAKKDPKASQVHFAEAVRLDPENKTYQLNLAISQLQSGTPEERTKASSRLRTFLDDAALRVRAARALRDYAIQQKDAPGLLEVALMLRNYPEAEFRDHIFYVQVLRQLQRPDFTARLTELQEEAIADPAKLFDVLTWMSSQQLTLLALEWIKRLPPEKIQQRPVPIAVANCYVTVSDWTGLQEWCKKANWGGDEFMRHAYLARASREQGQQDEFRLEWAATLKAVGSEGNKLHTLEQEVAKWGWKSEADDLLWTLTKDAGRQQAALAALYQNYADARDTGELYRVASRMVEIRPDDQTALNNFAQLSLLLNLNTERAHQVAQGLYEHDPRDPVVASTYAFSLFSKGKNKQALDVMNKLSEAQLREPATAAYYGIILTAAGESTRADEFLRIGETAQLFPEEKALLAQAERKRSSGK
jgi:predicted Zn-dependent protease